MTIAPARARATDVKALADRVTSQARGRKRFVLGVAGAPGSGKSTFAEALAVEIGSNAIAVSMDGFHLAQRVIDRQGTASRKGAPDTFDVVGFVEAVRRLQSETVRCVYLPEFRREIEEPIAGAIAVEPDHQIVIVEGNYLLQRNDEWSGLAGLFDSIWFLDLKEELRHQRLLARHLAFGHSPDEANAATFGSDERNAALIRAAIGTADLILE